VLFRSQVVEELAPKAEVRVLLWRVDQFRRLGFATDVCWQLACSDADLGTARRLRRARCPLETALEILL